jgi:ferritin-like metal-binding protein YciE
MEINKPMDVFVLMLSDVRHGAERSTNILQEIHEIAEDKDVKEILAARIFLNNKILDTLDECFNIIDAEPVEFTGRIYDLFVEDFRDKVKAIEAPLAKRLFVLAKVQHLMHLRMGEYKALIAAADMTGNQEVGLLLESCLADKIVLAERAKRFIKLLIEIKAAEMSER